MTDDDRDANPFGDDPATPSGSRNPFGEPEPARDADDAARRIEGAARRIRGMRSRLGSEGLTPAATRDLIEELATALEAAARGLRGAAEE